MCISQSWAARKPYRGYCIHRRSALKPSCLLMRWIELDGVKGVRGKKGEKLITRAAKEVSANARLFAGIHLERHSLYCGQRSLHTDLQQSSIVNHSPLQSQFTSITLSLRLWSTDHHHLQGTAILQLRVEQE